MRTMKKDKKYHVAILAAKWKLLERILDGRKTIESRWYVHKTNPWNNIDAGDVVYFKETGKLIEAKATVHKVIFLDGLNKERVREIISKYGKRICLTNPNNTLFKRKNYCILVFLKDVERVKPFQIDKKGFGNAAAWLTMDDVEKIRLK